MTITNGGKTVEVATVVSWVVSALAAISITMGSLILSSVQRSIEDNQALISQNQELILQHLLKHPDGPIDKRLTLVESSIQSINKILDKLTP